MQELGNARSYGDSSFGSCGADSEDTDGQAEVGSKRSRIAPAASVLQGERWLPRDGFQVSGKGLIFCPPSFDEDIDWTLAEAGAASAGWERISIQRAGTLKAEGLNGKDANFRAAYESAIQGRRGIVVYSEPLGLDDDAYSPYTRLV